MADIDALNQLLNNDAAIAEAGRRQAGALRTQELLSQSLQSFNQSNPNLARDANEWIQAQQARERLQASGAIPQRPAPTVATAPNPVNRPINAPPQPPLSTSVPRGIDPMGLLNNAAGAYAGIQAAGFAEQALQDGIEAVGDRLVPASVRPVYDRVFDEANRARGMYLPTPVAGIADAARALRRMPPLSPVASFLAPVSCALFGQGCTDRTLEGVPYAGDRSPPPPFFGGQSANVRYRVTVFFDEYHNDGRFFGSNSRNSSGTSSFPYLGRIGRAYTKIRPDNGLPTNSVFLTHGASGNPDANVEATIFSSSATNFYSVVTGQTVVREDGQPDTGGNPAPLPGTAPAPARAPIVQNPREIAPGQPQSRPANHPQTQPVTASPQPIAAPAPQPALQPLSGIPGNRPVAPPVTNPPPPQGEPEDSPAAAPQSNRPWWFIPALVAAPVIASPLSRLNGGQARPSGPRIGTASPPTSPTCSYDGLGISGKVDTTNSVLNTIQTVQLAAMQAQLSQINSKLGDQVEGGISGYLKKFWQWFHLDRIINLLTLWTTIHNAYMLSNGIAQTLFSSFDMVFQIFKFSLKDDEGNEISTGDWVSSQFDEFFKNIFGDENVDEWKRQWNRYNRIYQAAANIVNAFQSIMYSVLEALEVVGNYVAWIGNAAKKYGVVVERAYNWMNPNLNFRQNKFFKRLEQVQEAVETVEIVAGEVLNIVEMKEEIDRQKTELRDLITDTEREIQQEHSAGVRESVPPLAPHISESDETPSTGAE